tara:strand:- start:894 stop:1907 length:1014 start_codon:yes stop_codon:yes gene_type:complete
MKLNDFVHKKPVSRQASTQFIIENEVKEQKYQDQINALDLELGHYKNLESERDVAVQKLEVEKDKVRTLGQENSNFEQEITSLKTTVENQESSLERIPQVEEESRNAKGQLSEKQNELNKLVENSMEQSRRISALGSQVDSLISENKQLTFDHVQFKADKISAEEERKQVLEKNEEMKIFTDETSKINREVRKQNKEFRDEITYWEKEAKEISVQLEQALNVENNLRTWVTKLEQEEATNKTIKSGLDKNINTMEETVSEMGSVIDGLVKENNYLRGVNRDFRKQLARPKYLSMGSIAKKEGFKMPQGKENIRTKYLGNASPTLLKFKAKGEDSNAG